MTSPPKMKETAVRPKKLDEMLKIAKKVSHEMEFLRMDFYILKNGDIKVSEFTFTPANGLLNWSPKNANEQIYKKICDII